MWFIEFWYNDVSLHFYNLYTRTLTWLFSRCSFFFGMIESERALIFWFTLQMPVTAGDWARRQELVQLAHVVGSAPAAEGITCRVPRSALVGSRAENWTRASWLGDMGTLTAVPNTQLFCFCLLEYVNSQSEDRLNTSNMILFTIKVRLFL